MNVASSQEIEAGVNRIVGLSAAHKKAVLAFAIQLRNETCIRSMGKPAPCPTCAAIHEKSRGGIIE